MQLESGEVRVVGTVTGLVATASHDGEDDRLAVTVTVYGPGVHRADLLRLFEHVSIVRDGRHV